MDTRGNILEDYTPNDLMKAQVMFVRDGKIGIVLLLAARSSCIDMHSEHKLSSMGVM